MTVSMIGELDESHRADLYRLFEREWWTSKREPRDVDRMLQHTDLVFGLLEGETDSLVGFARVLTDRVYKAVILDVIIAEPMRGKKLGRRLMQEILEHPDLADVRHFELYCLPEMAPFYEQWGFTGAPGERFVRLER